MAAFETVENLVAPAERAGEGAVQDNDELVSAEASGEILRTDFIAKGAGKMTKDLIPGLVTEAIVDAFEAIQVKHKE